MLRAFGMVALVLLGLASAPAQALQLVSRAADGGFPNGRSTNYGSSVSSDGRYVVFDSSASNLVAGDTNGVSDIFLRDVRKGTTELISLGQGGKEANGDSIRPSISSDGNYVVFWSFASNLVDGDTNGKWDVYLRDLKKKTTERVNVTSGGAQTAGDNDSDISPSLSRNGKYIVWGSEAPDIAEGDTNKTFDIFIRDREKGTTEAVTRNEKGEIGNAASIQPVISDDGSTIAFRTCATNFIAGDENKSWDILVKERTRKPFQCATLAYNGAFGQANQDGAGNYPPSLSGDGRLIAFESSAVDLVSGPPSSRRDVYVRDLRNNRTVRISVGRGGSLANGPSNYPSISLDGRLVSFESLATNLVDGDINRDADVFVCSLATWNIELVSLDITGQQGNRASLTTRISGDGRWVVFRSEASNLLPGDRNGQSDVFILELGR